MPPVCHRFEGEVRLAWCRRPSPCVTAGAPLDGEALAVAMASHAGTERHVAVVRRILELGGFGEDALRCPAAWPADRVTRLAMIREDRPAAPVHALTLTGLARAIHRMGASSPVSPFALHRHCAAVVAAARAEPWAVDGPGRTDTIVAERTGVLCGAVLPSPDLLRTAAPA